MICWVLLTTRETAVGAHGWHWWEEKFRWGQRFRGLEPTEPIALPSFMRFATDETSLNQPVSLLGFKINTGYVFLQNKSHIKYIFMIKKLCKLRQALLRYAVKASLCWGIRPCWSHWSTTFQTPTSDCSVLTTVKLIKWWNQLFC